MTDPVPVARSVAASIPGGRHRMTVGLRPLIPAQWIEDAPDHDAQIQEKWRLLETRDDVVAALPGTADAQAEVLDLLAAHLQAHFPGRYRRRDDHLHVTATGGTVSLAKDDDEPPLSRAARLVPEDLCLMRADGGNTFRLVAAALCFPTRWRLAEKMGRPMLDIHAPVPGYAGRIGAATDRLMQTLTPARPMWRHNWSVLDSPVLYQPRRLELARPLEASTLGAGLWLRSERQTLRRLPACGDVLFTIRIRQCTLEALCREPGAAGRLREQIASMPQALKRYKGLEDVEPMLMTYLEAGARGSLSG